MRGALERFALDSPLRTAPVPIVFPDVGQVGLAIPRRGVRWSPPLARLAEAAFREDRQARRLVHEYSGGRLGLDDVLPALRAGTDSLDLIRTIKRFRSAISDWAGLIGARGNGKYYDFLGFKSSQTTVANNWSSFFRSGGVPSAGSYASIPGGSTFDRTSSGAMPIITSHSSGEHVYLVNVGVHHATGTNVVLLADLLVAAGNISATTTSAQTVDTTALPARGGNGEDVRMILEVTTALGGTAANITISYTNQAGTSGRSTGALSMTTSAAAFRLQPVAGGAQMPLQADDYGVRSVETATLSASMGGGVLAVLLYRPLVLIPTLSNVYVVERNTPAQLSGIVRLTHAAGGTPGCLFPMVLTSTTSTGLQTYFLQFVWG